MSKDDLVGYLTQLLWSGLAGAGLGQVTGTGDEPEERPRIAAVRPVADHSG
jgi:hypothetical protein